MHSSRPAASRWRRRRRRGRATRAPARGQAARRPPARRRPRTPGPAGEAARRRKKQHGLVSDQSQLAIKDAQGRVMVDLTPQAGRRPRRVPPAGRGPGPRRSLPSTPTAAPWRASSPSARCQKLAGAEGHRHDRPGVEARHCARVPRPPRASRSSASTRCSKQGIDGKGITVGVLSDSYDDRRPTRVLGDKLKIHAQQDIKSGDLPGKGNKAYPDPVVVLQDGGDPDLDTDEGRAMLQIVHDVAPAAKLCFATAYDGRGRASPTTSASWPPSRDRAAPTSSSTTSGTSTSRSSPTAPIGDAIDDVAAKGVHYFSAAGNDGEPAVVGLAGPADPGEAGRQGHQPRLQPGRPRASTAAASRT